MKPITREWVKKAEADFATAQREFAVKDDPNYDAVCFHSQQAAEKFLKARLQEAEIAFARIHDLTVLLDNVVTIEPAWENLRSQLHSLTAYAVEYRYPGESSGKPEAGEALEVCKTVRKALRTSFGLGD
jgi:HEPN domain-containing protein